MVNTIWQFTSAGSLKFGRGCRNQLAEQLSRRQLTRPLIVTDPVISSVQVVSRLLSDLKNAFPHATLFEGCEPEPSIAIAEAAVQAGASSGVDCVIGIGGGSNLDVAKIAATVVQHGGHPSDFFGFDRVGGPILPMFAVPTTAGTGSEVSHSAVLTDTANRTKVSTLSPWLRPTCAIVDSSLTDSCPPTVTAHSGIDALVHAVEAYTNRDYSEMEGVDPQARAYEGSYPLTRLLAAEAIRLVGNSLVAAYASPDSQNARDEMALAATLAGMAFSNSGVGIVHALEYPIGALTHCGHGEGNGLLLPHVMRYNLPVRQAAFREIGRLLGADQTGLDERACAEQAIESVVQLQRAIGIKTRLREFGMSESSIEPVADIAFGIKRLMDINPQTPTRADLVSILRNAY